MVIPSPAKKIPVGRSTLAARAFLVVFCVHLFPISGKRGKREQWARPNSASPPVAAAAIKTLRPDRLALSDPLPAQMFENVGLAGSLRP